MPVAEWSRAEVDLFWTYREMSRLCGAKEIILEITLEREERQWMTSLDNIKTSTGFMMELTKNGYRNKLSKMLKQERLEGANQSRCLFYGIE